MFNFVKENKNWIFILIITIVLLIGGSKFINSCSHSVVDNLMKEAETESIEKLSMYVQKEAEEVLVGIAKKSGDWSTYPLSEKFLKRYNSEQGIFPEYKFKDVDWFAISSEQYKKDYTQGIFIYSIGNNLTLLTENSVRTISITYYLNNKGELDDFIITSDKQTVDEYGDPVRDYDKEFTEKNIRLLTDLLFFDHWCWYYSIFPDRPIVRKEPISSKFANVIWKDQKDKSKGFIDFFDGLNYTVGNIYWLKTKNKKEAFNDNDLYCVCKLYREGEEPYYDNEINYEPIKNYLYKVDISLDSDKKLDDIKVKFIKEISNEELAEKYTSRLVDDK